MKSVAPTSTDIHEHARALNILTRKRSGLVTLTPSVASTVVEDINITPETVIHLMPLTANAATALGTTYIETDSQSFTINHANNAQVDRSFRWSRAGD